MPDGKNTLSCMEGLVVKVEQSQVGAQEMIEIVKRMKDNPNVDNFCFDQVCSPNQQNPQYQYQYQGCNIQYMVLAMPEPHNSDCPLCFCEVPGPPCHCPPCGFLHLTIAENQVNWKNAKVGTKKTVNGTFPVLNFERVISMEVEGPGCFILYANPNYKQPQMIKVYAGLRLSTRIPVIRSIEYWYD